MPHFASVETAPARFYAKVAIVPGGCWLWRAARDRGGYGVLFVGDRVTRAHRFSYELHLGSIPERLDLDHLCRVRRCVNPEHLEPVTRGENTRRGVGLVAANAVRVLCYRGHPFDAQNTYVRANGKRNCRMCRSFMERKRSMKHRGPEPAPKPPEDEPAPDTD